MNDPEMREALRCYETQINLFAHQCVDPWFASELRLYRSGDKSKAQDLCGSLLHLVLEIAKKKWSPGCRLEVLDLVQEGNTVVVEALETFVGSTAQEFKEALTVRVNTKLDQALLEPL
jgi:DNA-directed RNA polymerase sigma subunit (sigma70/sigma32)